MLIDPSTRIMSPPVERPISRRAMLAALGGMSFYLALGRNGLRIVGRAQAAVSGDVQLTPWVRIAPDDTVTIYSAGAEMGQGSMTSLALIVAEEMDADWSKVRIEFAPTDAAVYGYPLRNHRSMAIVGSRAVQVYFRSLRIAGAQVRKVLLTNAGTRWGVDPATLKTEPGAVVDPLRGRRLSYGEIAAAAEPPAIIPAVDSAELKPRKEFRLIGRTVPRRDVPGKVNGSTLYAIDVRLPGMAYATALHSPVAGGEAESWNEDEIKRMPGIISTMHVPGGIAVVASQFEQAIAARDALEPTWKPGKATGYDSERALEAYARMHAEPSAPAAKLEAKGDVDAAFAGAASVYRAAFRSDYGYHAQLEPLNAVVALNGTATAAEVWEGSQSPDATRRAVARALGLNPAQITVHQCHMGGGFGRRTLGDYAAECARIAKEVRRPVKLIWTREEDVAHGMFRPQACQFLEAAQDPTGRVIGWRHSVVGDGGSLLASGMRLLCYRIPNVSLELRAVAGGVPVKHWRAVGHLFNTFAIESFVDHLAAQAGMDPLAFRLQHMSITAKARRCCEAVAQMCQWSARRPDGRALGISASERSGSVAAGAVEIAVDRASGRIRVHKVWLAIDAGLIVTPGAARANAESGILYGLSAVLHERITVRGGVVEQSNFHDYRVMRMSDLPDEIEVAFLDSETRPTGIGEIGVPFVPGAVANAFFRLTGRRLAHLPFTPERVLAALER
jgi:isoquinoline 1-oxidoreductase beta subunit